MDPWNPGVIPLLKDHLRPKVDLNIDFNTGGLTLLRNDSRETANGVVNMVEYR